MVEQSRIIKYYTEDEDEHNRLTKGSARLERIRTESILSRFLPEPPATIVDVGGGTGVYSFPLAKRGYIVHLIDLVPNHIEKAKSVDKLAKNPVVGWVKQFPLTWSVKNIWPYLLKLISVTWPPCGSVPSHVNVPSGPL